MGLNISLSLLWPNGCNDYTSGSGDIYVIFCINKHSFMYIQAKVIDFSSSLEKQPEAFVKVLTAVFICSILDTS